MGGPRDSHTECSQTEKEKYHIVPLLHGIKKMKHVNLFTKQKQTHRLTKQTYGYQG